MRLAKYLAHAGVASRRAAETVIAGGRVSVDGEIVLDPARDVGEDSRVTVDGRVLDGAEARVVYAVHKPLGVISTARDTHGRSTVLELLDKGPTHPAAHLRLYPVGRLDADSSGLILLTNDGGLANRLTHPRFEVPKTYRAKLGGGSVGENALAALRDGVELDDGPTAPARVQRIRGNMIELTIHEGRKRQVRRMCEAVGHPVLALERTAFGPLRLDGLAPGAYRRCSDAEVEGLRAAADGSAADGSPKHTTAGGTGGERGRL
jgi:23S rRNA pseudouridine2605 synthase